MTSNLKLHFTLVKVVFLENMTVLIEQLNLFHDYVAIFSLISIVFAAYFSIVALLIKYKNFFSLEPQTIIFIWSVLPLLIFCRVSVRIVFVHPLIEVFFHSPFTWSLERFLFYSGSQLVVVNTESGSLELDLQTHLNIERSNDNSSPSSSATTSCTPPKVKLGGKFHALGCPIADAYLKEILTKEKVIVSSMVNYKKGTEIPVYMYDKYIANLIFYKCHTLVLKSDGLDLVPKSSIRSDSNPNPRPNCDFCSQKF